MKKLIVLNLITLLYLNTLFAQNVAGYLGKRTFVGASINYMPNVFCFGNGLVDVNYNKKERFYLFNPLKYGLSVGYVLSNFKTLQVDLETQKMGLIETTINPLPDKFNGSDLTFAKTNLSSVKVKIQNSAQHCAPIGIYRGLTFGMVKFNSSYQKFDQTYINLDNYYDYFIGYTGGVKRVFNDKFMLDLSIEGNVYLKLLGSIALPNEEVSDYVITHSIRKNGYNNLLTCRFAFYYLL